MARSQYLVTTVMLYAKYHIEETEEKHCLVRRLEQQLLESTYQPPLATASVGAWVFIPPTSTPSETDRDENRLRRRKRRTNRQCKRRYRTRSTSLVG